MQDDMQLPLLGPSEPGERAWRSIYCIALSHCIPLLPDNSHLLPSQGKKILYPHKPGSGPSSESFQLPQYLLLLKYMLTTLGEALSRPLALFSLSSNSEAIFLDIHKGTHSPWRIRRGQWERSTSRLCIVTLLI